MPNPVWQLCRLVKDSPQGRHTFMLDAFLQFVELCRDGLWSPGCNGRASGTWDEGRPVHRALHAPKWSGLACSSWRVARARFGCGRGAQHVLWWVRETGSPRLPGPHERRGRDSNPRNVFTFTRLSVGRLEPLGHPGPAVVRQLHDGPACKIVPRSLDADC